jgi:hypothetical protein
MTSVGIGNVNVHGGTVTFNNYIFPTVEGRNPFDVLNEHFAAKSVSDRKALEDLRVETQRTDPDKGKVQKLLDIVKGAAGGVEAVAKAVHAVAIGFGLA